MAKLGDPSGFAFSAVPASPYLPPETVLKRKPREKGYVSEQYRRKETGGHSLNMDKAVVITYRTHSTESEKNELRSLAFLMCCV